MRAGQAEVECALGRDHADADRALLPDAVVGQQRVVFVDVSREKRLVKSSMKSSNEPCRFSFMRLQSRLGVLDLADLVLRHGVGQVAVHAARAEIGRVHARAGDGLVHVEQVFAFAEAVDQDGRAAAVVAVRAEPHQVVQQARDLG
jgi:hypothetical protein